MRQLIASQDAAGRIRSALSAFLPDPSYQRHIQDVGYEEGIVTIRTTSKSLAAHLLIQTGPLRTLLKTEGVRVERITVT
jgi:hypothetical protein